MKFAAAHTHKVYTLYHGIMYDAHSMARIVYVSALCALLAVMCKAIAVWYMLDIKTGEMTRYHLKQRPVCICVVGHQRDYICC